MLDASGRFVVPRVICQTMYDDITPLERAFEIAKSGDCATVTDMKAQLKKEGHSLDQISGDSLLKQLKALMAEARKGKS